jgi:hypothetical protein
MRAALIRGTSIAWIAGVVLVGGHRGTVASTFEIVAKLGVKNDYGGINGVLAADSVGNLYAVSTETETAIGGAVFELTAKSGYSRVTTLYNFAQHYCGGSYPSGGVSLTSHGVILGTTEVGGTYGQGTVYDLGTRRNILCTALHSFSGGVMKAI